jgi:hypothetical protein
MTASSKCHYSPEGSFLHYNLKIYTIYAAEGAIAAICPCGYAVLQGTRIDALKA